MQHNNDTVSALKEIEPSCNVCEHSYLLDLETPCSSCEGWLNFKLDSFLERLRGEKKCPN